jgi:CBS domain containing-hemolysin-like protein
MVSVITSIVSLLVLSLFAALEISFLACNRLKIELDLKQERRYAHVIEILLENSTRFLHSLKIASVFFLVLFGVSLVKIFSPLISEYITDSLFGIIIIEIFLIVFLAVVPANLLPKWLSVKNPNLVLEKFYWLGYAIYYTISPFMRKSEVAKSVIPPGEPETSADIEIIQNALNFSDVLLKECMIPRTEICAISKEATLEEVLSLFAESNYSRIPVFAGSVDRIVGYIHSKDLFAGGKTVSELIRPVDFVTEEMNANALLAMLTKNKRSLAVVLDEYGGTAGIVTLEDLIEEIFGEISDELDKEELSERKISDNEFIFSARKEIKYLNKTYDLNLPESDEYETLGGLITYLHENIPNEGEILSFNNFSFKILKTASNRVETVSLKVEEE